MPDMKMNTDIEWLRAKAAQEDGCMVSVGGLVCDLERRCGICQWFNPVFGHDSPRGRCDALNLVSVARTDGTDCAMFKRMPEGAL